LVRLRRQVGPAQSLKRRFGDRAASTFPYTTATTATLLLPVVQLGAVSAGGGGGVLRLQLRDCEEAALRR
jgi:hypothetical protein